MTTNRDLILSVMRAQGKADALDLRSRAPEMDGTAIIAEEDKTPVFDGTKDYSGWAAGSPVREMVEGEWQVFTLITPHNASHYPGSTPANTPSLWSLCRTKDPAKAKPWRPSNGTSGRYHTDECAIETGRVYKNKYDNNEFSPSAMPDRWEDLGTIEEIQGGE